MLILVATGCTNVPTQTTSPSTALSECGDGFSSECVNLGEGVCFDPVFEPTPTVSIEARLQPLHRLVQSIEDRTAESTCWQLLFRRCDQHPEVIVNAGGFGGDYYVVIETETDEIGTVMKPIDSFTPGVPLPVCTTAYFGPKEYEQCAWNARNWISERSGECSSLSEYCDMDYCTHFAEEFQ